MLFPVVFFLSAIAASIFVRHHDQLDETILANSPPPPRGAVAEGVWRSLLRFFPALAILVAVVILANELAPEVSAVLGGLIVGQSLVELQGAYWLVRRQRRLGVIILTTPRNFALRRGETSTIYQVGDDPRDPGPGLETERSDVS